MSELQSAVEEFLSLRRIAVAGVSRSSGEAANLIFEKLRGAGFEVFAVNPNAGEIGGVACYPDLGSIPGGVEGVVIATHPEVSAQIVEQCRASGVRRVWMHRSFGRGSVSEEAIRLCRQAGIMAIPGACPMMYCRPVDLGHRCMRWLLKATGGLPRPVRAPAAAPEGGRR